MNYTKQIFVVGNSRSGTTMMGRILGNHSDIFTFKELHFFGQLWSSSDKNKVLSKEKSIKLFSTLLCINKYGIFNKKNTEKFNNISKSVLSNKSIAALDIFKIFLKFSLKFKHHSTISCDQTPRNVFYIQEILDNFPNAKIINMTRDPRDVLLSQKNKWKRRYFGASSIPLIEVVRSYFNYHPITISKIWNSCIQNSYRFQNNDRVKTFKFEDLLLNSEKQIKELCDFLGIDFSVEMIKVPNVGSSTVVDNKMILGLDNSKIGKWKSGGISKSEIYICQKICGKNMKIYQYKMKEYSIFPLFTTVQFVSFPIKLFISFLLNLHRIKNLKEVISKRILNK